MIGLLPPEIIVNILTFLPARGVGLSVALVCRTFALLAADELLWKALFIRDFGLESEDDAERARQACAPMIPTWKLLYWDYSSSKCLQLVVTRLSSSHLAFTNRVYVNSADFSQLVNHKLPNKLRNGKHYCIINGAFVYLLSSSDDVPKAHIGLSAIHRKDNKVSLDNTVTVESFLPPANCALSHITFTLSPLRAERSEYSFDTGSVVEMVKATFDGHFFVPSQTVVIALSDGQTEINVECTVNRIAPSFEPRATCSPSTMPPSGRARRSFRGGMLVSAHTEISLFSFDSHLRLTSPRPMPPISPVAHTSAPLSFCDIILTSAKSAAHCPIANSIRFSAD